MLYRCYELMQVAEGARKAQATVLAALSAPDQCMDNVDSSKVGMHLLASLLRCIHCSAIAICVVDSIHFLLQGPSVDGVLTKADAQEIIAELNSILPQTDING